MSTPDPLDDVAFLARSPHRVVVLETLADGSRSRPDLHAESGISQPTLGRVLGGLEDRNWVERRDGEYALTPWGELLAADFADLLETVASIQRLGAVADLLPTEHIDFDLREFADATVTTPTAGDAFRHVRRVQDLLWNGEDVRNLTPTVAPGTPEEYAAQRDRFLSGTQRAEAIISADAVQDEMDDEYVEFLRPLVESDRADLHLYDGEIPFLLGISDGTVVLCPFDEYGIPSVTVESRNETVRAWAERTLDEYRAASTHLTGDIFGE